MDLSALAPLQRLHSLEAVGADGARAPSVAHTARGAVGERAAAKADVAAIETQIGEFTRGVVFRIVPANVSWPQT